MHSVRKLRSHCLRAAKRAGGEMPDKRRTRMLIFFPSFASALPQSSPSLSPQHRISDRLSGHGDTGCVHSVARFVACVRVREP